MTPGNHQHATRWIQALFWAAAAFAMIMALLPHPPHFQGEPSDKVEHMVAFATLGLLGTFGFPRLSWVRLLIGLSAFGALIEVAQAIPFLHRDSDPLDWIADTVACAVVLLVLRLWIGRAR